MESSEDNEFFTAEGKTVLIALKSPVDSCDIDLHSLSESRVCEGESSGCDLGLGRRGYDLNSDSIVSSIHSKDYLLQDSTSSSVKKYGTCNKGDEDWCMRQCCNSHKNDVELAAQQEGKLEATETEFPANSIGTSLQQQKNICRKDVENVFIHKMIGEIQQESSNFSHREFVQLLQYIGPETNPMSGRSGIPIELRKKFFDAIDEVDRLKSELTARCRQLESKHKAIEILQVQLEQAYRAHKVEYEACQNLDTNCRKLEKELDEVKWEFEVRDYQVGQSQESWRWRYEKIERENRQLHSALDKTQSQLKAVQRENTIMEQEKQELLCLMQLNQQNEVHSSSLAEADTYHLSAAEMSILGSCNCDSSNIHPCRCAWSLVNSRKEIQHLQNRVKDLTKKNDDNLRIIDLYRNAFEDQLDKNKKIFVSMVNKQLNPSSTVSPPSCIDSRNQSDEVFDSVSKSYMFTIIEMLRDRTEELFHKRLSTQLLADKIYQLEKQVKEVKASDKQTPPPFNTNTSSTSSLMASSLTKKLASTDCCH